MQIVALKIFSMDSAEKFLNGDPLTCVEDTSSVRNYKALDENMEELTLNNSGRSTPELNFKEVPESLFLKGKVSEIESLLNNGTKILEELKNYALTEGGLVNDRLRKKAWPILLGLDPDVGEEMPTEETLRKHPEFAQVVLDVNRSLKRFPPGIPYEQRLALQDQLTNLILRVITKYPHLRYYQGYHDVAVTFLLVVGEELAFRIMEQLSTHHLRDCMEPTMEKTSHLLNYIYPLINRLHPRLCLYLEKSGVGTMFCLPWFLTWYGHNLNHYKDVVRLYDLFLATPPLTPLYLAAVMVTYRQEEIFSSDCEMASIHCLLSQIPDELPFQDLIEKTLDLYEKFPPISVEAEVLERTNREKEQRRAEEEIYAARRKRGKEKESKWHLEKYFPRSRTQLFLLAVSVAMGIYAYLRADLADSFPPR